MAILYGTTGDGTTLPVLVDQFGNLLAKGIDGEPGPPGPPGVGQLPPDPYEGAILGWQDGELAWLGGSVPLPAGTYGPYTYIDGDERLDIPQDASSLVNGQQLYMSDFYGDEISAEFSTDTIASVDSSSNSLIPTNYSSQIEVPGGFNGSEGSAFDGNDLTESRCNGCSNAWYTWNIPEPHYAVPDGGVLTVQAYNPNTDSASANFYYLKPDGSQGADKITVEGSDNGETGSSSSFSTQPGELDGKIIFKIASKINTTGVGGLSGYKMNGVSVVDGQPIPGSDTTLTFPTDNNFDKFEVGDVVQTGASITAIDDTVPSITVDGGSWSAGDTSLKKVMSGSGSVFLGTNGAILLRSNNGEWVDDFYVTAPEQRIAARKVSSNVIKRKKK